MSARIDIFISGMNSRAENSIEFFADQLWDQRSEARMLKALQEILALVRPGGKSLVLDLTVRAEDPEGLKMIVRKKLARNPSSPHQKLSSREIEVFGLIVQGCTNKVIAAKLFISFETVRTHRKNILEKTGCANTAMLINYYHGTFFDRE